jgi:ABC-type Mn2+/Zn2+ transport system permease subunit
MINALIISALVAVPTAMLSCFLVLKGWSLMGDAISHAVFPGVVIAYIVGLPYAVGAFAAGIFCAVATGFLKDNSRIKQDTVMGIVFSGMFGLGSGALRQDPVRRASRPHPVRRHARRRAPRHSRDGGDRGDHGWGISG